MRIVYECHSQQTYSQGNGKTQKRGLVYQMAEKQMHKVKLLQQYIYHTNCQYIFTHRFSDHCRIFLAR